MNIPVEYQVALDIAKSKGFARHGFYFTDGNISTPHLRTKYFAKYFFASPEIADSFNESNDPKKFIRDYIIEIYPDWAWRLEEHGK